MLPWRKIQTTNQLMQSPNPHPLIYVAPCLRHSERSSVCYQLWVLPDISLVRAARQLGVVIDKTLQNRVNSIQVMNQTVLLLVSCLFASWQHLGSYQSGYWLVTMCTHYDIIVLHRWETMNWYPTQSPYPDTDLTSLCPVWIMPSARLGSNKYQFL